MSTARAISEYAMLCPKCGHETIDLPVPEGLGPQSCPQCHGVWFERGQLSQLMGTVHDIPEFKVLIIEAKITNYDCPSCKKSPLLEMPYGRASDTLLDWCNGCGGLWLSIVEGALDLPGIVAKLKGILMRPTSHELKALVTLDGPLPYDDFRVNLMALPLAVVVVSGAQMVGDPALLLGVISRWIHELGHLVACVVMSYPGYALPSGLDIGGNGIRSWVLYGVGWVFVVAAGFVGLRERLVLPTMLAIVVLAAQNFATFLLPPENFPFVFTASGLLAELVIGTLFVCAFYYRMPPALRWSWWRPIVLLFGVFTVVTNFELWSKAVRNPGLLPWNGILGFDVMPDLSLLHSKFGWKPASLVECYLMVAMTCYIVVAAHYLFFLIASKKNKIYFK